MLLREWLDCAHAGGDGGVVGTGNTVSFSIGRLHVSLCFLLFSEGNILHATTLPTSQVQVVICQSTPVIVEVFS